MSNFDNLTIHLATLESQENLRLWKNSNRYGFCNKEIISIEQNIVWCQYLKNQENNYMFIVQVDSLPVGCIGIRLIDREWDVNNLILGRTELGNRGYIRHAFKIMLNFLKEIQSLPIRLKVLKTNPAMN